MRDCIAVLHNIHIYEVTFRFVLVDLDENRDIVQQFRKLMDNKTDSYRVLMAEVQGSNNRTGMYFEVCDYPFNFNLISGLKLPGKSLSQSIEKSVSDYLAALPKGKWPNWAIGNDDVYRVGDRVQDDNINAMNVLLLTLPGTPTTYYGEEIGMVNGEVINGSDPMDPERTPMQWTSGKDAGNLIFFLHLQRMLKSLNFSLFVVVACLSLRKWITLTIAMCN